MTIAELKDALIVALRERNDATAEIARLKAKLEAAESHLLLVDAGETATAARLLTIQQEFHAYKEAHCACVNDAIDAQVKTHDEIESRRDGIEARLLTLRAALDTLMAEWTALAEHQGLLRISEVRAKLSALIVPPVQPVLCAICGKPATCIGAYEQQLAEQPACDDCCGHGNEDGHCSPLATVKDSTNE